MKFKPSAIIRFYIRWVVLGLLLTGIYSCILFITLPLEEVGEGKYSTALLMFLLSLLWTYILHKELWEKLFATIYISTDKIIWRCPFRKTRQLPTEKCYIGVEKENAHNKGSYPYIYFSLKPYPREFEHKIDKIPCSDEFVKYRYHPDIAEYTLKTLPKEQTKRLDYFHYMYQRDLKS